MGTVFSYFQSFFKSKSVRVVMIGLDNAGKTTICKRIKLGDVDFFSGGNTTVPTIGFNVDEVNFGGSKLVIWDIGGQKKIRDLWRHYYNETDCIIFVVDASDRERMYLECDELKKKGQPYRRDEITETSVLYELGLVLDEPLLNKAPVLFIANKTDIDGCMTEKEIVEKLELNMIRNREWKIVCSGIGNFDGIIDGLGWINQTVGNTKGK